MEGTTKTEAKVLRDIYYYRRRLKNRIFSRLSSFFAEEARKTGITKKDLAIRLNKDPAQITRWLSGPSNLTLDTLSDLLLAMDAEADPPAIVKFSDRPAPNYVHPLVARATGTSTPADRKSAFAGALDIHLGDVQRSITTSTSAGEASLEIAKSEGLSRGVSPA